jgi:WS/DGAT/MGAT family acyltransferase
MSGVDASFLSLETAKQPMQVFSTLELDTSTMPGGYSFENLREALAERIRALPEFREKLSSSALDLDHPVWVEDSDFDIDRHVRRMVIRPPGGRAELAEICAKLGGLPVDRSRPLWEMWVIEGLSESAGAQRVAVLLKVHHAAADGMTFVNFLSPLCSPEPQPPRSELAEAAIDTGALTETIDGLVGFVRRPLNLITTVLPAAIAAVIDAVRRRSAGRTMAAPFTAPRTVLNTGFTAQRNIAFARLDLRDVKAVKDHFGVKVNDVVMALVSGAVRQFMQDRAELPGKSLVAMQPVSVHGLSESTARNQVSGMLVHLQTDIADPVERLKAVAEANRIAKEQVSAISPTLLEDFGETVGAVLLGMAKRVYARLTKFRPMYNVILSNVPGPDSGRYFLGAEIEAAYPFGPILLGAGINFTLWSMNGYLHMGLISCPSLIPNLSDLAEGVTAGLGEFVAEIGGEPTASAAV